MKQPHPLPVLETSRLRLRPMTSHDAHIVVKWRNMPHVADMSATTRHHDLTIAEHLVWFSSTREDRIDYILELKDTSTPIGSLSFSFEPLRHGRWAGVSGRYIGEPGQLGKGYAYEAAQAWLSFGFDTLQFDLIKAVTRSDNLANIAINEKLGFEITENIKNSVPFTDMILTRSKWKNPYG